MYTYVYAEIPAVKTCPRITSSISSPFKLTILIASLMTTELTACAESDDKLPHLYKRR